MSNQFNRINLELTSPRGRDSHVFTTKLRNPIRVSTHPFHVKLSSLSLIQTHKFDDVTIKYDLILRKYPDRNSDETKIMKLASKEVPVRLTEDHYKNFRVLSDSFKWFPEHEELEDNRTHYHKVPEFVFDGNSVTMRFLDEAIDSPEETDQLYFQLKDDTIPNILGVSLVDLNNKLKDLQAKEFTFHDLKIYSTPDLFVHCSIVSQIGYKNIPSDLIRVVRVPQDRSFVHIDFDDDFWAQGQMTREIKMIRVKMEDEKGRPWPKHLESTLILSLEGNLYKMRAAMNADDDTPKK